jgi:hypothetical protein
MSMISKSSLMGMQPEQRMAPMRVLLLQQVGDSSSHLSPHLGTAGCQTARIGHAAAAAAAPFPLIQICFQTFKHLQSANFHLTW